MDNIFCSSPPCRTGSCSWRTPEIPLGPVTVLNAFWHWTERKISEKSLIASFQIIPDHHIRFMSQWGAKSANSRQIDITCIRDCWELAVLSIFSLAASFRFRRFPASKAAIRSFNHSSPGDLHSGSWKALNFRSFRIQNSGDASDA